MLMSVTFLKPSPYLRGISRKSVNPCLSWLIVSVCVRVYVEGGHPREFQMLRDPPEHVRTRAAGEVPGETDRCGANI